MRHSNEKDSSMTENIITAHNLSVEFPDKVVFRDLNIEVPRGSFLSIVGDNGAGKTTFLRVVLGHLKPASGGVTLSPDRKDIKIGYVPQFRNLTAEYPLSIKNFVALGLTESKLPWLTKREKAKLEHIIAETELTKRLDARLGTASGGEKQKAYLAQALVEQPDLLILDESTASLDNVVKYELLDLVTEYQRDHDVTVIFVTHDLPLAQKYATDYLLIQNGQAVNGKIKDLDLTKLKMADLTGEVNSEVM